MKRYIVTMQAPNGSLLVDMFTAHDETDMRSQAMTQYPVNIIIHFRTI